MNEEIIKNLNKILPVVERVHSDHHPELHQVAALYAELKQNPSREVFDKLRDVTKNYTLPEDAFQEYTMLYKLLY